MENKRKKGIAKSFSDSANNYNKWAGPQRKIAQKLVDLIPQKLIANMILDMGCGTGYLTGLLLNKFSNANITGIDLAPGMINYCKKNFKEKAAFFVDDAEHFKSELTYSLIVSSCSFQWLNDLHEVYKNIMEYLLPGGLIYIAVPIEGSLVELIDSYKNITGKEMDQFKMNPAGKYLNPLKHTDLILENFQIKEFQYWYPDAKEVLKSFKGIGAVFNYQKEYKPLSLEKTKNLISFYEKNYSNTGKRVPVTYKTLYYCIKRK